MLSNSIALTQDPLPQIAGFTASIHGMYQTGMAGFVSFALFITKRCRRGPSGVLAGDDRTII